MASPQTAAEVHSTIVVALASVKSWSVDDVRGDIDSVPAYGCLRHSSRELLNALDTIGSRDCDSLSDGESDGEEDTVCTFYAYLKPLTEHHCSQFIHQSKRGPDR